MKRLLTALTVLLLMTAAYGQGIPFIRNYTAEEYHANNTNYDIETDENGNVFVANFEGLLYYDYAEWRIIHTPGITRSTVVFRAKDNTICRIMTLLSSSSFIYDIVAMIIITLPSSSTGYVCSDTTAEMIVNIIMLISLIMIPVIK